MNKINPADILFPYKNANIDYLANNGNIGDMLIHKSTMIIFSNFNIKLNLINNGNSGSRVLFVSGGGNLIEKYDYLLNHLKRVIDNYEQIVILPHTYNGNNALSFLKENQHKLKIYCRELTSYKLLEESGISTSNLFLSDDFALHMNLDEYKEAGIGTLYAFREDMERTSGFIGHNNYDLSKIIRINNLSYDLEFWNMDNWEKYLNSFIEILASYQEIHTNRLHVAIAAALLEKKVILYPNSYFKNKAVYQYSLSRIKGVEMRNVTRQNLHILFSNLKNNISYKLKLNVSFL